MIIAKYKVFKLTSEGRLVTPEFSEGYGHVKSYSWRTFDTETEALDELSKDIDYGNDYIIVPVYRKTPK